MRFLIQRINGRVCHDFTFELENSIEYQNWKDPNDPIESIYCELEEIPTLTDVNNCIPVGTIEFVYSFIDHHIQPNGSQKIRPLNVPHELMFQGERMIRNYEIKSDLLRFSAVEDWIHDCVEPNSRVFIKSNDRIKSDINGIHDINDIQSRDIIPDGNYQISSLVNILSEYRVFIYQDMILGIQYYNGDFMVMPDTRSIKNMVDLYVWDYGYGNAPVAWTLDVAVINTEFGQQTAVIECHEFFSCGLYGFTSPRLPFMFSRTWYDILKRINQRGQE